MENAFKAVQAYVSAVPINGFTIGEVNQVQLDSSQKYLSVNDGNELLRRLMAVGRALFANNSPVHWLPVCSVYDKSVDAGTPPHVVLDLTTSGLSSAVIKALTRNLGLPTVSGSYGKANDIK